MKKRVLTFFICILLIAALIVGCAAPQDSSAPQAVHDDENLNPDKESVLSAPEADEFSLYDIDAVFDDPFELKRTDVDFSELAGMRYEGLDEFKKAAARMEEACTEEGAFDEIKELYDFLYGEIVEIDTSSSVAYIEYSIDFKNEELADQSLREDTVLNEMRMLYEEAVKKVLASGYGEDFASFIGKDVAESFSEESYDRELELDFSEREDELVMQYYEAVQQEFSVNIDGEEWTENLLYEKSDMLTDEQYYGILDAILEKKNKVCVPIYLELVELRKDIAALHGYDDAAEYYYEEIYSRGYSPEEAKTFHASVKKHIVPAYQAIRETKAYNADAVVETENIIPIMNDIIPRISEEMAEILRYMTEHEMIYLADDLDTSMDAGYTTLLSKPAQAFVYNAVYGDMRSISDTFHEFGHYCDFYLNGIYSTAELDMDNDQAEVCSTGLEMLIYEYYDEIFVGDTDDEKISLLYTALGNIISGCMYDEAQQRVFAYEGELTADAVNDIFRDVAAEYGQDSSYDQGFVWVEVIHTFEVPFYYLSYAAAYSTAMEIWLTAQEEGQDAAIHLYLDILSYGSFEYGYEEMLDVCGMRGFSSEKYIEELAKAVTEEIDTLSADF